MIHLNEIDPDWQLAQTHGKACKTGRPVSKIICPCCFNFVEREQCNMSDHIKSLDFLGFGVPLFYTFVKNCIILLLILAATYSSIGVLWAYQHNMQLCQQVHSSNSQLLNQIIHHDTSNTQSATNHTKNHFISLRKNHQFVKQFKDSFNPKVPHNNDQHQPHHLQCSQFFVKISRVQQVLTDQQIGIRLISFVCIILVILFNKQRSRSLYNYFDQKHTTLSDYSIIITFQYRLQNLSTKINDFFHSAFSNKHVFQDIILLPQFEQISQKQKNIKNLNVKKGQLLEQQTKIQKLIEQGRHQYSEKLKQINQELKQLDKTIRQNHQELVYIAEKSDKDTKKGKNLAGKAILIVNTQEQKHEILKQFPGAQSKVKDFYFGTGNNVKLEQAPEPKQILWQNIDKTPAKRLLSLLIGFLTSAVLIGIVTVVFYQILCYKTWLVQMYLEDIEGSEQNKNIAFVIVLASLVMVILLNKFVLGYILHQISHHQLHETQSSLEFSFCIKYAVCQFFTTALMTLAVEAIRFDNYFKHHYGVIEQESIMFIMTTFLIPLIWLINPFHLYVQYRRSKNYGKRGITQNQANHIMSDFNYDIGKRYAEIIKVVWFTFLYCPLIPMGTLLSIIGLGLYYWVDKYNLLYRSSINQMVSGRLNYLGSKLIDLCPLLKSLGQLIFDFQLRETYHWLTFVELAISLVFFFIPWNQVLQWIQGDIYELTLKKYEDIKNDFDLNYRSYHPVYKIIQEAQTTETNKFILENAVLVSKMEPRLRYRKSNFLVNNNYNFFQSFDLIKKSVSKQHQFSKNNNQHEKMNKTSPKKTTSHIQPSLNIL